MFCFLVGDEHNKSKDEYVYICFLPFWNSERDRENKKVYVSICCIYHKFIKVVIYQYYEVDKKFTQRLYKMINNKTNISIKDLHRMNFQNEKDYKLFCESELEETQ